VFLCVCVCVYTHDLCVCVCVCVRRGTGARTTVAAGEAIIEKLQATAVAAE